jgi:predicted choloylglycine hydrolase
VIFGRNFDFPPFGALDTYHCLTVVKPTGKHAFVSIGYPGMVGIISGMNDAGLAVATLDVYQSADGAPIFDAAGVPLAMTYRRLLEECSTLVEAETLLKSVHRTTYMNLAAADPTGAVVFEITPQTVGVRRPQGNALACTNHFQLDGLSTPQECGRIRQLNRLMETQQSYHIADVQAALHRVNQGEMTLQTMIFEPESRRLHVAMGGPGPVSNHQLKVFDAAEWFTTNAAE